MVLKSLTLPVLAGVLLVAATPAAAQTDGGDCGRLAGLRIDDTDLLSATVVPAAGDLPEYCRVLGYVRPAINFEIRLPVRGWNGKFYMAGCGGFCGRLDSDRPGFTNAMNYGLRRNYAVATMDGGHWGASLFDGRWAWNNRLAEIDFGQRAVHETARVGKAVIRAYYSAPEHAPARSYFAGCSNGGRMAAMEAARFPEDFDGIISGAPALDFPGLVGTTFAWLVQANTGPDGRPILTAGKVGLIRDAVYQACDAGDGLADGLIDDPRRCDWRPEALRCRGGETADCLTAAEIGVFDKWYDSPRNSRGQALYPGGIPRGSEPFWPFWLLDNAPTMTVPILPLFGQDFLRYMAFAEDPGESYSIQQFDFDRDPLRLQKMGDIYNPALPDPAQPGRLDPDLRAFRERGGRMIMYHGWADPLVTPQMTVAYYQDVERTMGGRAAAQEVVRLFMVPGMDHCGLLPGPGITETGMDPLTALEAWVEQGTAPAMLLATKRDQAGATLWTRPLCPFPQVARDRGEGDLRDAGNFTCAEP